MLLEEIENASSVTIIAKKDDAELQFNASVTQISEDDLIFIQKSLKGKRMPSFITLDLIKDDSFVVVFDKTSADCELTATIEEKPYKWRHIRIAKIHLPDSGYKNLVFSFEDVDVYNRRQEFRINFDIAAMITLEGSSTPLDVLLRDVSPSGLGFRCNMDTQIQIGDQLQLQFKSTVNGSSQPSLFTVNARVVQITEMENRGKIVGCEMMFRNNKALQLLLNEKQRNQLKAGK